MRQRIALIGIFVGFLLFLSGVIAYFRFQSIPHEKSFYYLWGHVADAFWEVHLPLILAGLSLILIGLVFFLRRNKGLRQNSHQEKDHLQRFFIFSSGEFKSDEVVRFLDKAASILNLDHQLFVLFDSYDNLKRDLTAERWKQLHYQGHEVIYDRDVLFYDQPGAFAQDAEKLFNWLEPLIFFNYSASLTEFKQKFTPLVENRELTYGIPYAVLEQVLPALVNESGLITRFDKKSN